MLESELFERAVTLELEKMAQKEDVKALKTEAKEAGHDTKDIALVMQSAKLHVADTFEEKEEATLELFEKYRQLTGYDSPNPENASKTAEFLKQNPEF